MAKGLGVSKDKIHVDYDAKLVTIDMENDEFSKAKAACEKALDDSGFGMKSM